MTKRTITNLFIVIFLQIFLVSGVFANAPSWANVKSDKNFVYGVGMSHKNINPKAVKKQTGVPYGNDYVEDAREKALKNLAETVCGGKADTKHIKGFEVYKIYETKDEYWISFRLTHEMADKARKECKMENANEDLKDSRDDFRKSVFDDDF